MPVECWLGCLMKKSIAVVLVTVIVLLVYFTGFNAQLDTKDESESAQVNMSTQPITEKNYLSEGIESKPLYMANYECKYVIEQKNKRQNQWRKRSDETIRDLLNSYDPIVVRNALIVLDGGFFAYRKRDRSEGVV